MPQFLGDPRKLESQVQCLLRDIRISNDG